MSGWSVLRRLAPLVLLGSLLGVVPGLIACSDKEVFPPGPPTTSSAGVSNTASSVATSTSGPGGTSTTMGSAAVQGPIRLKEVDSALLTGNFVRCPDCHSLLDQPGATSPALVASFSHGLHLGKGIKCADCHAQPTHTEQGIRLPPMKNCFTCHSQKDASAPPGECTACHPAGFPLKPSSHSDREWLPVVDLRETVRGKHSTKDAQSEEDCSICHDTSTFCRGCHKTDMPHPKGWQELHKSEAKKTGETGCSFCHAKRQACAECHHKGYVVGGPPWIELHPKVALEGGKDKCIRCHSVLTCSHCHVTGDYKAYD